jgi:hypothetical protein
LVERDLFRKPVSAFRDHALGPVDSWGIHTGFDL